jgi:hypothetical protein
MKKLLICFVTLFWLINGNAFAGEKRGILDKIEGGLDKIFGQDVETGADVKLKKKNKTFKNKSSQNQIVSKHCKQKKKRHCR